MARSVVATGIDQRSASAGEHGDTGAAGRRVGERAQGSVGRCAAQRLRVGEQIEHLDVVGARFSDQQIVHQREVRRAARLLPHRGERVPEPMIEVLRGLDRLRHARQRAQHGGVLERGLARVLEEAAALHVERHLAGHDQHRRAVGFRGRNCGRHIARARPADAERGAEAAAGARIAVGHVDRTALVRRHDRLERALPRQCRQERIPSPPGTMNRWPSPSAASASRI